MHQTIYTGYTLVDITATGQTRGGDELARNQQRNWETVLQAIGLTTQPIIISPPRTTNIDLGLYTTIFGEMYSGVHRIVLDLYQ